MIDPTFRNINSMFVQPFSVNGNDNYDFPDRSYFDKYYIESVEIKNFNVLINIKSFFEQPKKNKQEAYEKIVKMPRSNDSTTGLSKYCTIKNIINSLA